MKQLEVLLVHSDDNVAVALHDLRAGAVVQVGMSKIELREDIPAKHKFSCSDLQTDDPIVMYGLIVGKAVVPISSGRRISTKNTLNDANSYTLRYSDYNWTKPKNEIFASQRFMGYHRSNGSVGTRNYWLVIPMVFCENRNIEVIRESMLESLGYATKKDYGIDVNALIAQYRAGDTKESILQSEILKEGPALMKDRIFQNVDGIKFLTHEGGCGGIRQDSELLCKLFAGYINHPNVAGATVLSLGCQNAEVEQLNMALNNLNRDFNKPLYILEQQQSSSERHFIEEAIKKTFVGLMEANKIERRPASIKHLTMGLECGGSDGFSGITANPTLGIASDILVAASGKAILAEFPELHGIEQNIIDRSVDMPTAKKFIRLMESYSDRAVADGSGFDMNPSPGNIKDGLITDAMKSAGAAKKGGSSPVVAVLDYSEPAVKSGLNLLCTPGNDVESTTGLAGSGANIIVFTTGLGTPTGNPITPVIKMASNSKLAHQMKDIIDINAGTILDGDHDLQQKAEELMELIVKVASGEIMTKSELLGQDDFIPWKRGISL